MKKIKISILKLCLITGLLMSFSFCFANDDVRIIIRKDNPIDPQPDQPHIMMNFHFIDLKVSTNMNELNMDI